MTCKPKSKFIQEVEARLKDLASIVPNANEKLEANLLEASTLLKESGGIEDIVDSARKFFSESTDPSATFSATKTLSFAGIQVPMDFFISAGRFTYLPQVNLPLSTEDALKLLDGVVYSAIATPSNTSKEEAISLATSSYPDSPVVRKILSESTTSEEIFTKLADSGISLFTEINVLNEVKNLKDIENSVRLAESNKTNVDSCGSIPLSIAPFSSKEIHAIDCECCKVPPEIPNLDEIQVDSIDFQDDVDKVESFLNDLQESSETIASCGTEKRNALNNYYLFLEVMQYNEIAEIYFTEKVKTLDALKKTFGVFEEERNTLIARNIFLNSTRGNIISETSLRLFEATELSESQLEEVFSDAILIEEIAPVDTEIFNNENRISEVTSYLENKKNVIGITSFNQEEILNFYTDGFSTNEAINSKFTAFKKKFLLSANLITNTVGYNEEVSDLKLLAHPLIRNELETLFLLGSQKIGELKSYIESYSENFTKTGIFEEFVWKKYYTPNQVDRLFTYQEQGYTSPKPEYDDNGNSLGNDVTVTLSSPDGTSTTQNVSEDLQNLGVDDKIALDFWPTLEEKTKLRINALISSVKNSSTYKNYIALIKQAAADEAKLAYSINLAYQEYPYLERDQSFKDARILLTVQTPSNLSNANVAASFKNAYRIAYEGLKNFSTAIRGKIKTLETFIQAKNDCVAEQEEYIAQRGSSLFGDPETSVAEKDCKSKLGSDPFGLKPPSSECPSIVKNCYWREYTKVMQLVSLFPVIDTSELTKRLFRYWPVAIQLPSPTGNPYPTLASGIPDALVSIPLPFVWKHIVSLYTPIGLMVVWIAMTGPIPCPYVMFIDENMDAAFLVSLKGKIAIPANQLRIVENEKLSLIEFSKILRKIPTISGILGDSVLKFSDVDSFSNLVDGIGAKIKSHIEGGIGDPTLDISPELRTKLSKAFKTMPPDIDSVKKGLEAVENSVADFVDRMKIPTISIPSDGSKLTVQIPDIAKALLDMKNSALQGVSLQDLGIIPKVLSVRTEFRKLVDRQISSAAVSADFDAFDRLPKNSVDEKSAAIKSLLVKVFKKVTKTITPEMLGFAVSIETGIPSPIPCTSKINIIPVPSTAQIIITAMKLVPSTIEALSNAQIANLLKDVIDLTKPLPLVKDMFFYLLNSVFSLIPDLKFPSDVASSLKQIKAMVTQEFFKFKVRMPRVAGIPFVIPAPVIKSLIKGAIIASTGVITLLILKELDEAGKTKDLVKVVAAGALIKTIFGVSLENLNPVDIKSFISSLLDSALEELKKLSSIVDPFLNLPKIELKSIKEKLFGGLSKPSFPATLQVGLEAAMAYSKPVLEQLSKTPVIMPLILQGCANPVSRFILTKVHPFAGFEQLPSWEKISTKNIPFLIWLDQLVATAQKAGGIGSNYVAPYSTPDI